ncbi:MAG: DMT family transporter [Chitinophagaceae bacterium]
MNAASFGLYLVLARPLMQKYSALQVIRWVFTLGLIWVQPLGWKEFREVPWQIFTREDWMATGFVVFFTTFLAYFFNSYGLKNLNASTTGAYIYLQPLFATIVAVFFFGESLTWIKMAAAGLIFSGVYLVNYPKRC